MSCIYCPEGATWCRWCNPPAPARSSLAERFPGATATQQDRARRGLHPMGHPMPALCELVAAERCGACAHRQRGRNYSGSKTWSKCALAARTGGPATDTRAGWPACARWMSVEAAEAEARAELAARAP